MLAKLSLVFSAFLQKNFMVTMVILAVFAVRFFLRKCPKKYSYLLWAIVGIRMVFDLPLASRFSLFNVFHLFGKSSQETVLQRTGNTVAGSIQKSAGSVAKSLTEAAQGTADVHAASGMTMREYVFAMLGIVWIAGTMLILLYGIYSYIRCRNMTRTAVLFDTVSRRTKIWECDGIPSPFVLGVFCPQIYIPFRMNKQEQQYILAHEQCHIRRHDPLLKLLAFVLLAVYWWNPFAWAAFFFMTRDMEMSCDEAVIEKFGNNIKKGYSSSLLAFAMERHPYSFAPVAFGEGDAGRRIQNVLNFKKPQTWVAALAVLAVIVAAVSCLTSQKPVSAKNAGQSGTSEQVDSTEEPVQKKSPLEEKTEQKLLMWAQAFSGRDAEEIVKMASKEAQQSMKKEQLLRMDGDSPDFGWSSPWPWGTFGDTFGGKGQEMDGYRLAALDTKAQTAKIIYYAETSDPQVTPWVENVSYTWDNDKFQITKESLNMFEDGITSFDMFDLIYREIDGTQMDYRVNGMGETLNKNMVSAGTIQEPAAAARSLLNLPLDESKVSVEVTDEKTHTEVDGNTDMEYNQSAESTDQILKITFSDGTYYVRMIQPWGKNGIWIPANN